VAFDGVIWYKFMIQKLKNIASKTLNVDVSMFPKGELHDHTGTRPGNRTP
jgi:hypothetical protein